jgi:hypothetical protein
VDREFPVAALAAAIAPAVNAHFKLLEPASWLVEDDKGDPQKLGPCGGTLANPGTPTNAVTVVTGGQKLKVVVEETVYHPGHYRIALSRKRNFLPADPVATMKETERGPRSASGAIEANPQPPILLDGLWPHHEKPTANWETEITIPNITCEGCQLQVIQSEEHPFARRILVSPLRGAEHHGRSVKAERRRTLVARLTRERARQFASNSISGSAGATGIRNCRYGFSLAA